MSLPEIIPPATWNGLLACRRCGQRLAQPGALLFSPPLANDTVRKLHICAECFPLVEASLTPKCCCAEVTMDGMPEPKHPAAQCPIHGEDAPGRPHDDRIDRPEVTPDHGPGGQAMSTTTLWLYYRVDAAGHMSSQVEVWRTAEEAMAAHTDTACPWRQLGEEWTAPLTPGPWGGSLTGDGDHYVEPVTVQGTGAP